jgi:hypothetical protein
MAEKTFYDILRKANETHLCRGKMYNNTYHEHGKIMAAIFPDGITLITEEDFKRFSLFNIIIAKLHRYSKSFSKGGHEDSIHDAGVYSFMLEEVDSR